MSPPKDPKYFAKYDVSHLPKGTVSAHFSYNEHSTYLGSNILPETDDFLKVIKTGGITKTFTEDSGSLLGPKEHVRKSCTTADPA